MAERRIGTTPVDMRECKKWGHQMDHIGGPPVGYQDPHVDGWPEWLRCVRCSALRVVVLGRTSGKVTMSRYWLPDGYRWNGQGSAPTRADLRLEDTVQARRSSKLRSVESA